LIVVCGEALIDIVPAGDGFLRPMPGGGPFNTARALARLEVPAGFLGRLSTDPFGQMLAQHLADDGVDLSMASRGPEPTTLAFAQVNGDGLADYRFYFEATSAPNLTHAMLPARLDENVTALHVGTLGLMLEPMASTLFDLVESESARLPVMLDPNVRPALLRDPAAYRARLKTLMAQSTIVKASDADIAWLFPGLDLEVAADQILALGAKLVVVTLGARGAFGAGRGIKKRVTSPAVEVVDTIGAGDAFGAGLLAWLHDRGHLKKDLALEAADLDAALEFACLVASLTCTRAGAEPPRRSALIP
jgi:fructokinase